MEDQQPLSVVYPYLVVGYLQCGVERESFIGLVAGGECVRYPYSVDLHRERYGGVGTAEVFVASVKGYPDTVTGGDEQVVYSGTLFREAVAESPARGGAVGRTVFEMDAGIGEFEGMAVGEDGRNGVGNHINSDVGGVLYTAVLD